MNIALLSRWQVWDAIIVMGDSEVPGGLGLAASKLSSIYDAYAWFPVRGSPKVYKPTWSYVEDSWAAVMAAIEAPRLVNGVSQVNKGNLNGILNRRDVC